MIIAKNRGNIAKSCGSNAKKYKIVLHIRRLTYYNATERSKKNRGDKYVFCVGTLRHY